jgi:hypothetical protein
MDQVVEQPMFDQLMDVRNGARARDWARVIGNTPPIP